MHEDTAKNVGKDAIWLGERDIPSTDEQLVNRLWAQLARGVELPVERDARTHSRILDSAFGDHPVIAHITADLSGLAATSAAGSHGEPSRETRTVQHTTAAKIERLNLRSDPLLVEGVPIGVDVRAQHVQFDWVTDTDGGLWVSTALTNTAPNAFEADAEVRLPVDESIAAIHARFEAELENENMRVRDIDVDVNVLSPVNGEQQVTVSGNLSGRVKFFGAAITFEAVATVRNEAATVTVDSVRLSSNNPLLGLAFVVFKRKIQAIEGETFSIDDTLPDGIHCEHVEVKQRGDDLVLQMKLR